MELNITEDLWGYLERQDRPVVIYGMGNGADKVLGLAAGRGIEIADFFASDAFVRGQTFHGKTVLTYSQVREKYGDGNFIILLSFATKLPDVVGGIKKIAAENELYAPDLPVAGNNIFDLDFYNKYKDDLADVYETFADGVSKNAYYDIISYKLTGNIDYLLNCEHPREEIFTSLLTPPKYRACADLGAYTGDTLRELIEYSPSLRYAIALEPDRKNFRKLEKYAAAETRCRIAALNRAAWSEPKTLFFYGSGNQNSSVSDAQNAISIDAESLDNILSGRSVDYIKYDVEGSEMEALLGSSQTIKHHSPDLCVSLYHRSEDLFLLPMLVGNLNPAYKFHLRRGRYLPAWDINLIAVKG